MSPYNLLALLFLLSCTHEASDVSSTESKGLLEFDSGEGGPKFVVTRDGEKLGVGIFQAGTGSPILTLGDRDGDGVFDMLSYSVVDAEGDWIADVEDFQMDGQPDLILNIREKTGAIYFDGAWRTIHDIGLGKNTYVEIDGMRRPLSELAEEGGRIPF